MGAIFFGIFMSIPFHFIWNALAPTYFGFLPSVYQQIPLIDCMGLFTLIAILRMMVIPTKANITKFKWNAQSGFHREESPRNEKYVNR
jgi:hypothetical protein